MMELLAFTSSVENVLLTIIFVIFATLLLVWMRKRQQFQHIPCSKYNLPLIGNILRVPSSPKNLIPFQRMLYDEVKSKTRVFWLAMRPVIDTIDVKNIEYVLKSSKHIDKGPIYNFLKEWIGDGLLISSGEKWKSRRRLLTPAFHFDVLKSYFHIMSNHAKTLVAHLKKSHNNQPIEFSSVAKHYSLSVICETAMGVRCVTYVNSSDTREAQYVEAVDHLLHLMIKRIFKPWWFSPFLYRHFSSDGKKFYQYLETAKSYVQGVIENRIKELENVDVIKSNIFLDILIAAHKKGAIDVEGIIEEVNTFMFEGHDTVSSGISWIIYLLGRNEKVQNKVFEEILSVDADNISLETISQLKYLECVIKESLRIHPPVPGFSRAFKEDTTLSTNIRIPANIGFGISVLHMQRDDTYWENPYEFNPDRFLDEHYEKKNPFSFIPFSAGPRNCIGQRFAMMELKIVVFHLVRNFRFSSVHAENEVEEHADIIHRSMNGIWMNVFNRLQY